MGRHGEAEPDFLSNPYSEPDVDTYRTLLTDAVQTFLAHPRNLSAAVLRLMDNKVPLWSDAQRTNIVDTIWVFTDAQNWFWADSQLRCCFCAHADSFGLLLRVGNASPRNQLLKKYFSE